MYAIRVLMVWVFLMGVIKLISGNKRTKKFRREYDKFDMTYYGFKTRRR